MCLAPTHSGWMVREAKIYPGITVGGGSILASPSLQLDNLQLGASFIPTIWNQFLSIDKCKHLDFGPG